MAFVSVFRNHVPVSMLDENLNYLNLEKPTIGFKEIPDVTEFMDKLSEGISDSELKKYKKRSFLLVALFDIWLRNDDRNVNNTNILTKIENNKIVPIAIDHESIFNTGSLDREIYELTYEDSLFYANLYHRLFKKSEGTVNLIHEVCATLHEKVSECYILLDNILADIPDKWSIDRVVYREKLENNIFQKSWLNTVEATFRNFSSLAIQNP